MPEEVDIKITAHPLRLVYLVRSREDITDAVTLYTHTWGGVANWMFPMPTDDDVAVLRDVLNQIDPDIVFIPKGELAQKLVEVLERGPFWVRLVKPQEIHEHANGPNLLHIAGGELSHTALILQRLHRLPLQESQVRIVVPNELFGFELMLHGGNPTEQYREFLVDRLAAQVLPSPISFSEFVKTAFVLSTRSNPLIMSSERTRWTSGLFGVAMDTDPGTLHLFLDDEQSIETATAFWNNRKLVFGNKLYMSRNLFFRHFEETISLFIEALPVLRALHVVTPLERGAAAVLRDVLKDAFATQGREVSVMVVYKHFGFDVSGASLKVGQQEQFSQTVMSDASVRFRANIPPAHENTRFLFGYDAYVRFTSGRQLVMPPTRTSSILLSNELERIENAERNERGLGDLWLRTQLVRLVNKGVAGITRAGEESRLYLHSDDVIINQHVKAAGLRIKSNRHTRYAQGFIKRFGGMDTVMQLVNEGGLEVLSALRAERAKQNGLNFDQIVSYMEKHRGNIRTVSKGDVERLLRQLTSAGFVRRGYALTCEHCDLTDWYPLPIVHETVDCNGCAQPIILPIKLQFYYTANELVARFVESGGPAVLMTASLLRSIEYSSFIQFGGDLSRDTENRTFVEVDLLWLTDDVLAIAECKAYREVGEDEIAEFKDALAKKVEVAPQIGAKVVLLGVLSNKVSPALFEAVRTIAEQAEGRGIGVHLVVNARLYLWGHSEQEKVHTLNARDLVPEDRTLSQPRGVGETPNHWGFSGANEPVGNDLLVRWEHELQNQQQASN